jgi:hypothetical protein
MFCPTDLFLKRLFLRYVNMYIHEYMNITALLQLSMLYCKCIPNMLKETSKKKGRDLNIKEKRKEF